jgi:hypothetical protein
MDPKSARSIWEGKNCNMGIVLGPSGVIDFELDSGNEKLYWDLIGKLDTPIFFTGSKKPHTLFRDPGGLSRRTRDGLELRAGPHQSVIPPSIHPDTDMPYIWVNGPDVPLADPPQALLDFFSTANNGPSESHWREALGRKLGEGEGRHASLISCLGIAVNQFQTPEQLVAAAIAYASITQDPPYPDEVIEEQALDCWDRYREPPDDPDKAEEYLHVESLDKIQMRAVSFLWKPYLQKSAFHLLVGRKGAGKGSVLAWIAANFTVGFEAPDGTRAMPQDVLWIATEDSFEIDVKPRIAAQGGDQRRVHAVRQNILLPRDIPAIRAFCEKHQIGLVVIDPIVGVIGDADTNSEGPIVAAIGGLNQLADELALTVIGVRHTGKNMDAGMLSSVLGSVAWVNTPRAVLGIKQDEEKNVSLEVIASNRVRSTDRTWFRLEEAKVEGLKDAVVSKVVPLR